MKYMEYGLSDVSCAKMGEPIHMPFGRLSRVGPRNHVLDAGVHCGHLANTTEPSVCGSDVAYVKLL